jgi:hypothetical protein
MDQIENAVERRLPFLQKLNFVNYNSRIVGYDPVAEEVYRKRYRGYYQSFIYGEALQAEIPGGLLSTKESTGWLFENINSANEIRPIMMHVRRGDYFKVQLEFGILSEDFYLNALRILRNTGNTKPVWVFTDSPELLDKSFIAKFDFGSKIVIPPRDSTAAESLTLMQYGSANIISNSTYSWWPAFLSKSSSQIICPSKWFRNMETPRFLIPEKWTQLNSDWL